MDDDAVLARLERFGLTRRGDGRWLARCPAHDDRSASLDVRRGVDGRRVVVLCLAGCSTAEGVLGALGVGR